MAVARVFTQGRRVVNRKQTLVFRKGAFRWTLALAVACAAGLFQEVSGATRVAAPQDASEVGLKLEVDKREVEVGGTVTVTMEFRQLGAGGGTVVSQEPSIPTMENFDIGGPRFSSTRLMMVNGRSAEISTTRITLKAVKPGRASIGPALILYQDPVKGRREIRSNPAMVTVVEKKGFNLFGPKNREKTVPATPTPPPAASDPDELRDIRGLQASGSFPWSVVFWLALLSLVAAWLIRRLKRAKTGPGAMASKGPAEELRERHKRLAREDLDGKAFCREASSIARACLGYRYSFAAEDWTTTEILAELQRVKSAASVRQAAEDCLKSCDRVLYAEGTLGGAARESILRSLSSLLPKAGG